MSNISVDGGAVPICGVRPVTSDDYRRHAVAPDLRTSRVRIEQTDLQISGLTDLTDEALASVRRSRRHIEDYIERNRAFLTTLEPMERDPDAPPIVGRMMAAASRAGVGPMAAVAGAIAEAVGRDLEAHSSEIIVENGGDVYVRSLCSRELLLLAETSAFGAVRIKLPPAPGGRGVCTSSGVLGPSSSYGRADAVTAIGPSAALADAAATALANMVTVTRDVDCALARAQRIGLEGVVVIIGDTMGAWGQVEFAV